MTRSSSAEAPQPLFDVIVNHFATSDHKDHLVASALFAVSLSVREASVATVILVDGSPSPDPRLQAEVERMGARYHHENRSLSFAEGYNVGARLATAEWIILSASDVYPVHAFFQQAVEFIAGTAADEIGCIIPRLTISDLPAQTSRWRKRRVCEVPLMTLNLNLFQRALFHEIGGVPAHYSGAFNDVEMAVELRARGRKLFLLPSVCLHFGSLTISTESSGFRILKDRDEFVARHPRLARVGAFWDLDVASLCDGRLKLAMRLADLLSPKRYRRAVAARMLTLLPLFARTRSM